MTNSRRHGSVSLREVAQYAGVSSQTVSRVANGSDLVRPETAERVRRAMRELGYRPNYAARALKHGRFNNIGVILFNTTQTGNMRILSGISATAARHGYAVTLLTLDGGNDGDDGHGSANLAPTAGEPAFTPARALARMRTLPIDGVIIALERRPADLTPFLPTERLPIVLITEGPLPGCITVDADQLDCSEQAVGLLLDEGHRTVYHIAGPESSCSSQEREQAWRAALERRGAAAPPVLRGDWSADSGYDAGLELARDPNCTAVYASNDQMAYGCMLAMRASGRRVPEDVSVIGVDDSLTAVVPRLDLDTMRLPFDAIGERAFTMVMRACEGEEPPTGVRNVLPVELVKRGSVAAGPSGRA
ncbi:LacI family DNA-binding transcriptional regulator [Bifidobacterium avesanii]|uniref:LacI family DNA-binding transcriptional regulator n=1 Tax=Bifidobacterium avesanii TaxID=1798157 RepID=A0A7K3TGB0_9BIFI|nr:LacI family DNA-binding transcriptional regulator [Bifidobacterium avesanii]KAB8290597.1 LacI family transcriptional regulator [Bifidobacterium avesanii]NEG77966.1 LacI family DNA-binding transcriptional regulator [Bifidobacterium avesanii]